MGLGPDRNGRLRLSGFGGFFLNLGFLELANRLESAELFHFFFPPANEAVFLQLEIAELLVVSLADAEFDGKGAGAGDELRIFLSQLVAADGDERVFDTGDAGEAPAGIDDGLKQMGFFRAEGLKVILISVDMRFVEGRLVRRKKNGVASEAGFQGI